MGAILITSDNADVVQATDMDGWYVLRAHDSGCIDVFIYSNQPKPEDWAPDDARLDKKDYQHHHICNPLDFIELINNARALGKLMFEENWPVR